MVIDKMVAKRIKVNDYVRLQITVIRTLLKKLIITINKILFEYYTRMSKEKCFMFISNDRKENCIYSSGI